MESQTAPPSPTLYFAYGSNLSKKQMLSRCPTSTFYGLAILRGWRWIIGTRGYANIVRAPPAGSQAAGDEETTNVVYGMLYQLTPSDEAELDIAEGVPFAYVKRWEEVEVLSCSSPDVPSSPLPAPSAQNEAQQAAAQARNQPQPGIRKVKTLIYIDFKRTSEGHIQGEYITRMNRGIKDAVGEGMLVEYVESVLRRWVTDDGEGNNGVLVVGQQEVEDPFHPRRVQERVKESEGGYEA